MPATRPIFPPQAEPTEEILAAAAASGNPLPDEYLLSADEINELRDSAIDHADRIDALEASEGGSAAIGTLIGDGAQSTLTWTHNLGTTDYPVTVAFVDGDEEEIVGVRVKRKVNAVIVGPFHAAPGIGAYRVTVG